VNHLTADRINWQLITVTCSFWCSGRKSFISQVNEQLGQKPIILEQMFYGVFRRVQKTRRAWFNLFFFFSPSSILFFIFFVCAFFKCAFSFPWVLSTIVFFMILLRHLLLYRLQSVKYLLFFFYFLLWIGGDVEASKQAKRFAGCDCGLC